jgi:hypothetical protein
MTSTFPITPPPELVQEWCEQLFGCPDEPEINAFELVRLAAQWGADQELEACCEWLVSEGWFKYEHEAVEDLRTARRPKPPSLKEQAFEAQQRLMTGAWRAEDWQLIGRALEAIDA